MSKEAMVEILRVTNLMIMHGASLKSIGFHCPRGKGSELRPDSVGARFRAISILN